jgi:hypothetical protein
MENGTIDGSGEIGNNAEMTQNILFSEFRAKADQWQHEVPILRVLEILTEMSPSDLAGLLETAKRKNARRRANGKGRD